MAVGTLAIRNDGMCFEDSRNTESQGLTFGSRHRALGAIAGVKQSGEDDCKENRNGGESKPPHRIRQARMTP